MGAPPVLRDVFNTLRREWGEEDDGFLFEDGPEPISRLDVLTYHPSDPDGMTRFATIGMSVEAMPASPGPGGGGRAELRFARRGQLDRPDEHAIAVQLANLAIYPWATGEQVNWGHMVGMNREFPTFPGCRAVFLSGPLTAGGEDYYDTVDGRVRIINVVPVTDDERAAARTMPPIPFIEGLMARVDIYTGRS